MSATIPGRAIPTKYAQFTFRSRLEARAAIVMDLLGIRWLYEPDGFVSGDNKTWYCPDFFLPDLDCYLEIKPNTAAMEHEDFTQSAECKARMLAQVTYKPVYVAFGFPWDEIHGYEAAKDVYGDFWIDKAVGFGIDPSTRKYGFDQVSGGYQHQREMTTDVAFEMAQAYEFWKAPA